MNIIIRINENKLLKNIIINIFGISILALLVSCAANYGSIQRDFEVQQAFESNQIPLGYKYYYYGFDTRPYVVFGIDSKYKMDSHMWREAMPDTEEFKVMIRWIWEDYGYHKFGANILDPNGNKIGIYYSSINETVFKFNENNQIVVMPHTPFLWGPEDGGGGARTP